MLAIKITTEGGLCTTPEREDFCNLPNWCLNLLICDSFTADDAVNLIDKMVITDKKYPGRGGNQ